METQVLVYRGPVRWAGHALLAAVSVLSLFPLVWMVLNAFKPTDEILYFSLLPQNVTLQNFADALAMIPLPTMIVRSFASGVFQMVGQLCTGILAAYALTRWDFPGKKLFYGLFTVTWLVPFQATMLPNYVNLVQLGLRDTVAGIVLPNLAAAHHPQHRQGHGPDRAEHVFVQRGQSVGAAAGRRGSGQPSDSAFVHGAAKTDH